jgi:4-diphosphocytidyl-2-C-methyl-D-erythritol kinase
MLSFPNAKINLGLNIIAKRADDFHNIESVFYPVSLCDSLELIENKSADKQNVVFSSSGILIPGNNSDNLCYKAYELISKDYKLQPVKVHLHKHIPIGAGLGGGSADAAFFIKMLNELFSLNLSTDILERYAAKLGSDCSFFINNKPAYIEGKGDEHQPIEVKLKGHFIVLVYPHIHVNTAKAYSGVKPKPAKYSLKEDVLNLPIEQWRNRIHNDFEDSIFPQFPEIKNIKEQLYALGAAYAAMSGSGSTVFGIFKNKPNIKQEFSTCFVWEGILD